MRTNKESGILVTGASTGIGRASALALDRVGFTVFAGVRGQEAAASLSGEAPSLRPIQLDITHPDEIEAATRIISESLEGRRLFGLMNNAGITVNGPLEFMALDDLRHQLEVNLVAQLAVTQAFLPQLRESRGRIVNTGSVSGLMATPALGPYSMSKFAMEAFSDTLRMELQPWGIEVVHLQPGQIASEIWDKGLRDSEATLQDAPAGLIELYGPLIEAMKDQAALARRTAAPAEVAARAVVKAFTARRPRARYTMGGHAWPQQILSRLPSRWRDALVRRALRLP